MAGYSGLSQSLNVRGLGDATKAGDMLEAHDMLSLHGMFSSFLSVSNTMPYITNHDVVIGYHSIKGCYACRGISVKCHPWLAVALA